MNTPTESAEGMSIFETVAAANLWDKITNYSWMPLNLHRLVGNVTFGGFYRRAYCSLHVYGREV